MRGFALLVVLVSASALAQDRATTERRLSGLRGQISSVERQVQQTRGQEATALQALNGMTAEIQLREQLVSGYRTQIGTIQGETQALRRSIERLESEIDQAKESYRRRARHAYMHGRRNSLALILAAGSVNQMVVRARYLQQFANRRRGQVDRIAQKTGELQGREQAVRSSLEETQRLLQQSQAEQQRLAQSRRDREVLVADLRGRRGRLESDLQQRRADAQQLSGLVQTLVAQERQRAEQERQAQAQAAQAAAQAAAQRESERQAEIARAAEAQRRADRAAQEARNIAQRRTVPEPRQAAPEPQRAEPQTRPAAPEPRRTAPEPRRTAPQPRRTAPEPRATAPPASVTPAPTPPADLVAENTDASPARSAPRPRQTAPTPRREAPPAAPAPAADRPVDLTGSFRQNRGRLPWPVDGTVTGRFGTRTDPVYNTQISSDGIDVTVQSGAPARAVYEGVVQRVGTIPTYGTYIMVTHGEYVTLYGNLSQVVVSQGQRVRAGQVVGRAGTASQRRGNQLFFALYQGGSPVDPVRWLRGR